MALETALKRPKHESIGAGTQVEPDERDTVEKAEANPPPNRPSTGRTTALGRKVEKPAPAKSGGPSGQTDAARHDRKHTNK